MHIICDDASHYLLGVRLDYLSVNVLCVDQQIEVILILNAVESVFELRVLIVSLLLYELFESLQVVLLLFVFADNIDDVIDS